MKAPQSIPIKVTAWLPALFLLGCPCHADPLKPTALTREAILANPYSLTLTCVANTLNWSPSRPYITLNLTNPTSHTLFFPFAPGMDPNFLVFSVEYQAMADNPNANSGWMRLLPNAEPSPKPPFPGLVLESVSNQQRVVVLSHQTGQLTFPPDFPMSKDGFYRISAVLTVPEASEYQGEVPGSTKLGSFKLVARSKPLVIRRTAAGFAEVPAVVSKPVPAR